MATYSFHGRLKSGILWLACLASLVTSSSNGYKGLPDLFDITVDDIITGFDAQDFTSVDLVKAYIARIAEVQDALRPVIEVNPEAVEIARGLDHERLTLNRTRGPLHGVPVLLKDNIGTLDQLNTTAGSYALLGSVVPRDSTVAKNLRAAGSVKGAYYEDQDPSGSSSGSGVAASLGLTALTVGSDTGGSIIAPSGMNAVVGIRPSTGLVSWDVIVPITAVTDTAGPMTHSVKDAAYLLSAIAGPKGDPGDNYTDAIPSDRIPDYASHCTQDALRGAHIGVPRNWFPAPERRSQAARQQFDALDDMIPIMRDLDAKIVDNANFSNPVAFRREQKFNIVLNTGFKHDIATYFSSLSFNPSNLLSLPQLLDWTKNYAAEQYPAKGVDFWEQAVSSNITTTSSEFREAVAHNAYLATNAMVGNALKTYDLDALIVPSDYAWRLGIYAGNPVVSVPLGFYDEGTAVKRNQWDLVTQAPGVPFGLAFVGKRFGEAELVGLAYAFEQATRVREKRRPLEKFVPKTQLRDVMDGSKGLAVQCPDALGLPIS